LSHFSEAQFIALTGVALTSEAAPLGRIDALWAFAVACADAGDAEAVDAALAEATEMLDRVQGAPDADGADPGRVAIALGGLAEDLNRTERARVTYEAGLAALESDPSSSSRGVLWQLIGDTWLGEGNGASALESFRTAVALKRHSEDVCSRIVSLSSLIRSEAASGAAGSCGPAIREGIQALEAAVTMSSQMPDDAGALAHGLGRAAEEAGWPTLARRIYELTLELADAGIGAPRGVVCHDIADTWLADDEGEQALEALRLAARYERGGESALGMVLTLADLGAAELQWGQRSACEAAVGEAIGLLDEALGSPELERSSIEDVVTALAEQAEAVGRPDLAEIARARVPADDQERVDEQSAEDSVR
jgi:tetratricopeptide (TPR) repeat protein